MRDLGKKGDTARMNKLNKEQKTELARKAIKKRWEMHRLTNKAE